MTPQDLVYREWSSDKALQDGASEKPEPQKTRRIPYWEAEKKEGSQREKNASLASAMRVQRGLRGVQMEQQKNSFSPLDSVSSWLAVGEPFFLPTAHISMLLQILWVLMRVPSCAGTLQLSVP